jgi:hypothetical protein
VPNHELSEKLAARYREAIKERGTNVTVAVYRGRGNPDPEGPLEQDALCQNLQEIWLALKVKADLNRAVCGPTGKGQCPLRDGCEYFAQLETAKNADIVIFAHNFLIEGLREFQLGLLDNVNAIVVEEDIADHIVDATTALAPWALDDEWLDKFPVRKTGKKGDGKADYAATEELWGAVRQAAGCHRRSQRRRASRGGRGGAGLH